PLRPDRDCAVRSGLPAGHHRREIEGRFLVLSDISNPQPQTANEDARTSRRWALGIGLFTMLLTLVPYWIGAALAGGRRFMWLGYNIDDSCVYLSWMRQAADGSTRVLNLFTTEPQHGMAPNPFFYLLGQVSRFTGLPLLAVYHGSRILCGLALLLLVWEFV